jgi:hypothetical protein
MRDAEMLEAGEFASWLRSIRTALLTGSSSDVPCGKCNGCCRSSYFIHIEPDEVDVLASIPREILFPAPGLPEGNVVMGFNDQGCCPMLAGGACSIYEHRPRACRIFDCRVFSATGVGAGRPRIEERTRRWRFSYASEHSRRSQTEVLAAAGYLGQGADSLPPGLVANNPGQLAVLAIKVHGVFSEPDDLPGTTCDVRSEGDVARAVVQAARQFDSLTSSIPSGGPRLSSPDSVD